jgi:formylglycine-generating enzyme required for sulfatase activity
MHLISRVGSFFLLALFLNIAHAESTSNWRFSTVAGAGDVPLNVAEAGAQGKPGILFIHGFSQSLLSWEAQLDDTQLQENFHLVAVDLRGHGSSGKPWRSEDYLPEVWAEDIAAVIAATGIDKPLLVAWSFGGQVVMDYLRLRGTEKVAGLQLVGTVGRLVQPAALGAPDAEWVSNMLSNDFRANIRALEYSFPKLTAKKMPAEWAEQTKRANLMMPVYAKKAIGLRPIDNSDLAGSLNIPVRFASGTADPIAAPADVTTAAGLLPRSSVIAYKDIGHSPFAEVPDEFNRDLADFAKEINRAISPGTAFSDCKACPVMLVIPPGEFLMGSNDGTEERDERPIHKVEIKRAFAIGRYELTQAQFAEFIEITGHEPANACNMFFPKEMELRREPGVTWRNPGYGRPPAADEPVVCIDWNDSIKYVQWLSEKTGHSYRLLSEAEWEYVARAGATTVFPWGDDPEGACRYANIYDAGAKIPNMPWKTLKCDDGFKIVSPVGQQDPNAFGAYDMIGNVWEWTQDCYVMPFPAESIDEAPIERDNCDRQVVKGGSWRTSINWQRPSFRGRDPADLTSQIFGLRIARELP